MPQIKSLDRITNKWKTVTPQRQAEYVDGVQNPRKDWEQETSRAEVNYERGVQASIAAKSFGAGVRNAGTAKWQEKTIQKGPSRWAEGVALSAEDYKRGFAPFAEVIANTNLPERKPTGDPSNIQRVAVLAKALHDKKLSLGR